MLKRNFLLGMSLLVIVALALALSPAASQAQQGTGETFVFINYIGQSVTLDLDDTTYTVPGTNTNADGGRLSLSLAPGEHKYAVNAPGVPQGSAGTFVIQPGQVYGMAVRLGKTDVAVDRQGNVLKKPQDKVEVFEFNPLATPATPAPVVDTWQPAPAAAGKSSLVWINYTGYEVTVDLSGQLYKIPAESNGIPGRLQANIEPGSYNYTISVPYAAINGETKVTAGQVIGFDVSAEPQPQPRYDIGEPVPTPDIKLHLNEIDLTAQANANATATPMPGGTPAAATPVPAPTKATGQAEGLLIKNFTGDTLVFTINNQAYFILSQSEQTLQLSPGQYNYTASLPYVARTGTVDIAAGQAITLSVATNVAKDVLNIYQN